MPLPEIPDSNPAVQGAAAPWWVGFGEGKALPVTPSPVQRLPREPSRP